MANCKPDRPHTITLHYPGKGDLEIDLKKDFDGALISAIVFDVHGVPGHGDGCQPHAHPGKWKPDATATDEPPPGCCYVKGQLVCW